MLDLRTARKRFEVAWLDGTVYHLETPSQELLTKAVALDGVDNTAEQLDMLYAIALEIMNLNIEGKTFTAEEIAELDLTLVSVLIESYLNEILSMLGE